MDELAASFEDADAVVLTDIYAALEAPIPGVDVEVLARRVRAASGKPVAVVRDLDAVPGYLLAAVRPGDLVVTLGAGDVRRAGEGLLSLLAAAPAMAAHLTPPDRTDPGPVRD
jgi:UDP-N-acetylmuramate-alanine ligase